MLKIRSRKAFTLLELVVALVVLGILAALAIPTYTSVINSAKYGVAQATAQSVGNDAVAIAAIRDTVPTSADVQTAVAEVQGATATTINGAAPVSSSSATAVSAQITASNGVCVLVTFPTQVNGAVSTAAC